MCLASANCHMRGQTAELSCVARLSRKGTSSPSAPEALDFLGAGRSVYLVAGVQRLDGVIEAAHGNGVFSGTRAEEFTGTP